METMFATDLVHGVLSSELDLAIIAEPPENPMLTLVRLDMAPLYALMSIEHPAVAQRSVNEFGRAFLKKVVPNGRQAEASGQLLLGL
jgi:DNA-binding transcriptional LysR family regulator